MFEASPESSPESSPEVVADANARRASSADAASPRTRAAKPFLFSVRSPSPSSAAPIASGAKHRLAYLATARLEASATRHFPSTAWYTAADATTDAPRRVSADTTASRLLDATRRGDSSSSRWRVPERDSSSSRSLGANALGSSGAASATGSAVSACVKERVREERVRDSPNGIRTDSSRRLTSSSAALKKATFAPSAATKGARRRRAPSTPPTPPRLFARTRSSLKTLCSVPCTNTKSSCASESIRSNAASRTSRSGAARASTERSHQMCGSHSRQTTRLASAASTSERGSATNVGVGSVDVSVDVSVAPKDGARRGVSARASANGARNPVRPCARPTAAEHSSRAVEEGNTPSSFSCSAPSPRPRRSSNTNARATGGWASLAAPCGAIAA